MSNTDRDRDVTKLLERNRIGALLRVFATTPEAVEYQVNAVFAAAEKLLSMEHLGRPVFSRVDVLVSSDTEYLDSDCGLTAERLRARVLERYAGKPLHVLEISKGDIYCTLLNYGIANQMEDRVQYSLILSHGAIEYVTTENIAALLSMMARKARVAGIALGPHKEMIQKGRISNIFAMWHNKSLVTAGCFDLRAAQVKLSRADSHQKVVVGDVEYFLTGCEHVIPLLRMTEFFGPSIGVVIPKDDIPWKVPSEKEDSVALKRHIASTETYEKREEHMAKLEGKELSVIEDAVLFLDQE